MRRYPYKLQVGARGSFGRINFWPETISMSNCTVQIIFSVVVQMYKAT